jgi:hypothetical protein
MWGREVRHHPGILLLSLSYYMMNGFHTSDLVSNIFTVANVNCNTWQTDSCATVIM